MINIIKATMKQLETIWEIVQTTITEIYPYYYPSGAVEFFVRHHNDDGIKRDMQAICIALL